MFNGLRAMFIFWFARTIGLCFDWSMPARGRITLRPRFSWCWDFCCGLLFAFLVFLLGLWFCAASSAS